jgi:cytochrome c553
MPLLYSGAAIVLIPHEAAAAPLNDTIAQRVAPCMTCHGKEGRATSDGYYPRIAGKPAGYLYNQLLNFRDGRRRQYPLMTYMVSQLSDAYLQEMANYFAAQKLPYPPSQKVDVAPAVLERGRVLANDGDASNNVPACIGCHGNALTGVAPSIPGLLGLPRDYLNAQFGAWRDGTRHATAPDCMAQVAQRLSVDDISAVSAWLATQPVPADAAPATSASRKLPLACGSVPQ